MPNRQNSLPFWKSVAQTFGSHSSVIFGLFNEPFPMNNAIFSSAAWQWYCGCVARNSRLCSWKLGGATCSNLAYDAVGFQELLHTVRRSGAKNLLLLPGINYANSLTEYLDTNVRVVDPLNNTAASWHIYSNGFCQEPLCWNFYIAPVMKALPLVAGEVGEYDCGDSFINNVFAWLEDRNVSGIGGWTWNTW